MNDCTGPVSECRIQHVQLKHPETIRTNVSDFRGHAGILARTTVLSKLMPCRGSRTFRTFKALQVLTQLTKNSPHAHCLTAHPECQIPARRLETGLKSLS